jgi:hypothetical protein
MSITFLCVIFSVTGMNNSVGSGVIIEPDGIDGRGVSNVTWCKGSPDPRQPRALAVGVTNVGGAAGANAIGGGADDIGRDPVVVTTAICSETTCCSVCGDSRRGSDGGAMGLGEERLGDPRRGERRSHGFWWGAGHTYFSIAPNFGILRAKLDVHIFVPKCRQKNRNLTKNILHTTGPVH